MSEKQVEQNNPTNVETANDQVPSTQPIQSERFAFNVGDTIIVSTRITEDNRTRIQKFEGIVIAIKGSGNSKNFTVRRIGANDIGVERIFPMNSPSIEGIEVKRKGMVRRAKLYYLRDRKGKNATFVRAAK